MSNNKFDLFLEQANVEVDIKKNLELKRVVVDFKNEILELHLFFDKYFLPSQLNSFFKLVNQYFYTPNIMERVLVVPRFKEGLDFKPFAIDYFKEAIKRASKKSPSATILYNFDVLYENDTYIINIDEESTYIKEHFKLLIEKFKEMGLFNIKVTTKICEKVKTASEVIEESIKTQTKYIEQKKEAAVTKVEPVKHKFTRKITKNQVPIKNIPMDRYQLDKYLNETGDDLFTILGEIGKIEIRQLRGNYELLTLNIFDEDDAIVVKRFLNNKKDKDFAEGLKKGNYVSINGKAQYDEYIKAVIIMATSMTLLETPPKYFRKDKAKVKRVEFHIHTKMSNMDAVTDAKTYIDQAIEWGHEAICFTDHNGLYAYPEIYKATKGKNIKPIYGVELDYVDEREFKITTNSKVDFLLKDATYVVFDIETTGFSVTNDKIIEIGAVKLRQGSVIDRFQTFVNPNQEIYEHIKELTQIDDEMVKDAPKIAEILPDFLKFIEGSVLVAHNALFDIAHIEENAKKLNLEFKIEHVIDTLNLARYFYFDKLKRFNLRALARYFKVSNQQAHRAIHDAEATSEILMKMLDDLSNENIKSYVDINKAINYEEAHKHIIPKHINLIAKNQIGYKNIFKIMSDAQTTHFHQGPRALKSVIEKHREGIIISSGCVNGEVFEAARNLSDEKLIEAINYYDVIEVQPPEAYRHLEDEIGPEYKEIIEGIITKIINLSKKQGKIVIASGDVHYLDKKDMMYRDIYISAKLVGGGIHPLFKYKNKPVLNFLTTNEMLDSFKFLKEELAYEIVVENTNKLNKEIEYVKAFPDDLYTLSDDAYKDNLGIVSIKKEVEKLVEQSLLKTYGNSPHQIIIDRVEKELNNIIKNNFAPIYYTSYLLVKKSLEDGYLVGSRGSVGSSLIATLLNITEVNPLKPHYYCPNHDFQVFKMGEEEISKYGMTGIEKDYQVYFENVHAGHDLTQLNCPVCGSKLNKAGLDIPFETFLGFDGDKIPDIDLNFSGEYQSRAHEYTRTLLGENNTFRAGTIQTVAERNAFGYVKGYLEELGLELRNAQIERLASKIEGVKRSSGQHPGGIIVVPKDREIFDVTPVQYPADNVESEWLTTHFDYHSFEDNLLKLDILGHDDPTMIKFLMDYVKKNPKEFSFTEATEIPIDDPKVYELFSGTEVLNVTPDSILSEVGSYGVPELGTRFVRQMLIETKPNTFAGLVKISGLSHGTDVWNKNARDLIMGETPYGKIPFDDIIGCRDDIMVQLIEFGMEPLKAFEIMEFVRRGKPSKEVQKWLKYEQEMRHAKIPEWYIWSCSKIQYMFPKAHAAAYVTMAMRIAWFKVYKPTLFYSAFFTKRAVQFNYEVMMQGANRIRNFLVEQEKNGRLTATEEQLQTTLGVALEMTRRGFNFLPVDIEKSEAVTFKIEEGGLRMPLITIDGLGLTAATETIMERDRKSFVSKDDVRRRSKLNKTVFQKLEEYGAFDNLAESDDIVEGGIFSLDI